MLVLNHNNFVKNAKIDQRYNKRDTEVRLLFDKLQLKPKFRNCDAQKVL